ARSRPRPAASPWQRLRQSALTTIGAFATLALSDHRGTASMGTLLAIALVAAVAMAFALTPWLVRLARPTEPTDIPR
ncbi:MAG: MMPL family transporter, partial [Pseudomonadota bacterium]